MAKPIVAGMKNCLAHKDLHTAGRDMEDVNEENNFWLRWHFFNRYMENFYILSTSNNSRWFEMAFFRIKYFNLTPVH